MQIYMKNNLIYDFDRKKMFKARYIAKNNRLSQKYRGYDKKNMGLKSIIIDKKQVSEKLLRYLPLAKKSNI